MGDGDEHSVDLGSPSSAPPPRCCKRKKISMDIMISAKNYSENVKQSSSNIVSQSALPICEDISGLCCPVTRSDLSAPKKHCCVELQEYIRDEFRLLFRGQQQLIQMVEQLAKYRDIPPQTACGVETCKGNDHPMGVYDVKKETGFFSIRSRATKHVLSIHPSDDDVDKEVDDDLVNDEPDSDDENSEDQNIKGKGVAKDHTCSLDGLSVVKSALVRPRKSCPKCPYVRPYKAAAVNRF